MNKEKLEEIGSKFDVSEKDIKNIKKDNISRKIIYWIIGILIAIICLIIGLIIYLSDSSSYPYGIITTPIAVQTKTKKSRIAALLIVFLTFLIAIKATPVFGEAPDYDVFSKE